MAQDLEFRGCVGVRLKAKMQPDETLVGAPGRIQSSRQAPKEHRRSSAEPQLAVLTPPRFLIP